MIGKSLLYPGFRYAGVLESITSQRGLQSSIIRHAVSAYNLYGACLSIGTAYGDELAFFAREGVLDHWSQIVGIDIVGEVGIDVLSQPDLARFHDRLFFRQLDLQQLPPPFGENYWDCIQCGFVLEDIEYADKQYVYDKLFQSLNHRGMLIISEMFVDNQKRSNGTDELRRQQISELYEYFLAEARESLKRKILTQDQYDLLCGNGQDPGLVSTMKMAINGARDYFETLEQTEAHLLTAGFSDISYYPNPVFSLIGVIVARKE
ncbi:MAG: class I SAM-dependent methyltransferase [Nitrospirota bacterium]